jgi:lambda family phage portal protein
MNELVDAEIGAAKMAAKWLGVVKSNDPFGRQSDIVSTDPDTGQKIEEMENAIIEYLRPGEDIEFKSNPRPGSNFPPTIRFLISMLAVVSGNPYEILSGDYQGLNYSTSRTARNDFALQLRTLANRHIRHYCLPTQSSFLDSAVISRKLNLPGYYNNRHEYLRAAWQPPGMESIDPLRETKARIDEVKALLRSPQEIIRARGGDPEKVLQETATFKELAKLAGLDYQLMMDQVGTAVKNNPAAVQGEKNDKKATITAIR